MIAWLAIPLFVGFAVYLLPQLDRASAFTVMLVSICVGLFQVSLPSPLTMQLVDSFGVTLLVNQMSGYFVLLNALVMMAVVLYCWPTEKGAFFYTQILILHGSVNAIFVCADFMSLYVGLEVIGVSAFLLMVYPRTDRALWIGLRYLLISNTAMLFYLLGAVLVYQANQSFAFTGLATAPKEAIALIFVGLLTKGGIFVSGLWLPLTHSQSDTPVSALLSGAVIKTGAFPLVRCALLVEEISPIVQFFGVATAVLGTSCAILEKDTKRLLAWSTISQMGFVLVAPVVAGLYALSHGLAKAMLFLIAGNLPSRQFEVLQQSPLKRELWAGLAIASLSISGFPLLAGYGAKALTLEALSGWPLWILSITAVGSAIAFAKFIFLPFVTSSEASESLVASDLSIAAKSSKGRTDSWFWAAIVLLTVGLVAVSGLTLEAYNVQKIVQSLGTIAAGWLAYLLIFKRVKTALPKAPERFEHLVGAMSLVLVIFLWGISRKGSI
ncbi:NADH-Ubiquinone/plastoquinone (complex I), various chains domain protein [Synechococcus sp. PCC 7335]|uniref:cation:proton antiporter n=1 Tax=Synechococcus sp. (strain ATCC 29403 / PCC 7335) TaxID=91464 RepID=UPI00017EE47A|nr:cation:proton antiporter [Synechococcus sp. PCC 7335]EDX86661.1 NADH-Ubiquinone/plastoquinone (complex I), various chains domain protein [Synechococcus sp. PCC 7335]